MNTTTIELLVLSFALAGCAATARAAPAEPMYAKAGDGYLELRLDAGHLVVAVLDAGKKAVPVNEGAATMFLTYTEDGHKSKVDLKLEPGEAGAVFKAPTPKEGHGPTKAVVKVTADGKTLQGSFEFELPEPAK